MTPQERMAASAARQEAYRKSPERRVEMAARIVAGLCVVGGGWCVTHDVKADLGHDLHVNGYTWPDGTARND